jgi:hypothetical protein
MINFHDIAASAHPSIKIAVVVRDDDIKALRIDVHLARGATDEERVVAEQAACEAIAPHFEGWKISAGPPPDI